MYIYVYVYMYVYKCMYVYMYISIYVFVYVCMYVCIYVYIYTSKYVMQSLTLVYQHNRFFVFLLRHTLRIHEHLLASQNENFFQCLKITKT